MILVGIDIGKNQHTFSMIDKATGGNTEQAPCMSD